MKSLLLATVAACACTTAMADHIRPTDHAPIGVMGDHTHEKGEWMFSYRYMHMRMDGNRDGTSSLSPETIATTATNRFAMPPTLRVVPTEMTMDMHMFGAMYAPSDRLTVMAMVNVIEKEMDHVTFQGAAGSTPLGFFTTKTSGIGDTRLSALIDLPNFSDGNWHATLGVSLPTGSLDETDRVLTPMGTAPTLRLPYPMQLGSGTFDVIAGLTYAKQGPRWGWGAQWQSIIRTGENDENYTLGDELTLQAWSSYQLADQVSVSGRLAWFDRGNIDGIDPLIAAPVQTADPVRQGAQRLDAALGINVLPGGAHRLAFEVIAPLRQDLDGPQLETDWTVMVGWQYAY
ncbi:MAG: transporter [Pseudomonadota bacterium]